MTTAILNPEAQELLARVRKLPPDDQKLLAFDILDSLALDEPAEDPIAVRNSWRELIADRWKAIQDGTMPTVSAEDAIAYARRRLSERTGR